MPWYFWQLPAWLIYCLWFVSELVFYFKFWNWIPNSIITSSLKLFLFVVFKVAHVGGKESFLQNDGKGLILGSRLDIIQILEYYSMIYNCFPESKIHKRDARHNFHRWLRFKIESTRILRKRLELGSNRGYLFILTIKLYSLFMIFDELKFEQ